MEDSFKTFPYKFTNCEKLPELTHQCLLCHQFDCCKWKRRIEKELREMNWAERSDVIHWGHLEKLRKEILGDKVKQKMRAKDFLKEVLECKDCKPNFDGEGGFKFCKRHFKILKETDWIGNVDITKEP